MAQGQLSLVAHRRRCSESEQICDGELGLASYGGGLRMEVQDFSGL
ncbi:hypothetical protein CASFOL_035346 [Castilleja foliolosa]|uniref:Uncharacterized protein n=1 Tax=Castilleja foliolosa TaxID=1961234 RepID=A0ABD3BTA8_9LAMI